MNKKYRNILISFVFTAIIIYILLINISLDSLLEILGNYSLKILFITFLVHFSAYLLRTIVFYLFFSKKLKISFFFLLNTHFIHNFYVHVIPASLGEISFPILLRKKIQPEKSFSVLFVSRVLFLLLTLLLFLLAVFLNFELFENIQMSLLKYIYIFLLFIPVFFIYYFRKAILNYLALFKFFRKIKTIVKTTLHNIKNDLILLKNPGFFLLVVILTSLNIIALTLTYFTILKGMDLHLSFFHIIFVSSIGIAFVLLPIKSIGGFGTTEGAWALGMLLLGFNKEIAIESGFAVHLIALLNVVIMFILGAINKYLFYRRI